MGAVALLLAVGAASVLLIDHVNQILENTGFYNLQINQAAETMVALRSHPENARQNLARVDDLKRLARTDYEINEIARARQAIETKAPASQAMAALEQLSEYYRKAADRSHRQLVAIHQGTVYGVVGLMGGGTVLLVVIMVLVRCWFINPLFGMYDAIQLAIADDPARPLPDNEMRDLIAPVSDLVAKAKQLEERAVRAERLAVVGEACTRVGQNLRNLVSSMRTMAQYELDTERGHASIKATFEYIVASANAMDRWVASLINTTRPLEPKTCRQSIEPVIRDSVSLLHPLFSDRNITVDFEPADTLADVEIDRPLLEQALVAVLKNAMDASPDESRIVVITTGVGDTTVRVTIADEGEGMSEEIRRRACDPFFTKRKGGVGLGLTYVQQIVELHGGKIEIESEVEKGTRIHIDLPVAASRSRPGLARVEAKAPPSSKSALSASSRQ
jgi:signal transduction histidine kinase